MRSLGVMIFKKGLVLLPLVLIWGCGSSGPQPEGPSPIEPPVDLKEVLRKEGLMVYLESDKRVYRKGEEIRLWWTVRNEGSMERTLELRPWSDPLSEGPRSWTYSFSVFYYEGIGGYPLVWREASSALVRRQVLPGQEVRLIEAVWDQVRRDNGLPAGTGFYDVGSLIFDVYLDGRRVADIAGIPYSAEMRDAIWGIQIQE